MSYDCQLCQDANIPDKVYELLDWEAAAEDELVICTKCLSQLLKNKDAKVEVKLQKKTAVLARVVWDRVEPGDEEPGSAPDSLADEHEETLG
jgi:uncharacterized protein with PIN domain